MIKILNTRDDLTFRVVQLDTTSAIRRFLWNRTVLV